MTDTDLHESLREWREHLGLSLEAVAHELETAAEAAGVDPKSRAVPRTHASLSRWETGKSQVKDLGLKLLAKVYDVSVEQLRGPPPVGRSEPFVEQGRRRQIGRSSKPTTVPVVGYVQAGAEAILFAEGQGPFDEVPAPHNATENTVALRSRGESLGPLLSEWLVYYNDVRSPITPDMHGEVCVVGLPDGRVVVKQIKPAGDSGRFHLISQNEGPMLDQEVTWGAVVTAMTPR